MAKAPKAPKAPAPEPEIDDRLAIDAAPAQIDRARAHLMTRLRRLILESVYSSFDTGAIYRTVRDIQALDMLRPTQSDASVPALRHVPTIEEAAEAQRQAQEAHKAEEARKAARGD